MSSPAPVPLAVRRALVELGESFATWRKLRQLTVAEVADRADLSAKTIQRLEHGSGASLENTLRVARALGVLDELVSAVDPYNSDVGRLRSDENLPIRVRRRRTP